MKLLIINGPNLNLLGTREPKIYGTVTFEEHLSALKETFSEHEIDYFQSNVEGELINQLQEADNQNYEGIILNAAAYAHTSIAIADAVASIKTPTIAVHISNIYQREEERHTDLLAKAAVGGIFGLGLKGYDMAILSFITR